MIELIIKNKLFYKIISFVNLSKNNDKCLFDY